MTTISCGNKEEAFLLNCLPIIDPSDESRRIALAENYAKKDIQITAKNIQKFNITNQDALTKIAMTGSVQDPVAVAKYIKKFNITNETALTAIAIACAGKAGAATARYIRNFRITDPNRLGIIALSCAAQSGSTARYIQNFDLIPEDMNAVAQLCAEQDGRTTAQYIENFHLTDLTSLAALAKTAASQSGFQWISAYLENPTIKLDESVVKKLFLVIGYLPSSILNFLNQYHLGEAFLSLKKMPSYPDLFKWFISFLESLQEEMINPLRTMFQNFPRAAEKNDPARFQGNQREKRLPLALCFLFACLLGHSAEFPKWLHRNRNTLRDAFKIQKTVEIFFHLAQTDLFSVAEKHSLLNQFLTNGEDIDQTINNLRILFATDAASHKTFLKSHPQADLNALVKNAITSLLLIEQDEIPSIIKAFANSRQPQAIWVYASQIKQLRNKSVTECLIQFVQSVADKTFHQKRYDLALNPHLAAIGGDCVASWKESISSAVNNTASVQTDFNAHLSPSSKIRVIDTDDPHDLLLCGSENALSCQSINASSNTNKALLGYIQNGQNRIEAAVSEKGRILGRSILRLLWDGEKPVLYLERYYGHPLYKQSIQQLALKKALQMKLTLTGDKMEFPAGTAYPKPLSSLGGRAPYEYCDANQGIQNQSIFTIENSVIVDPHHFTTISQQNENYIEAAAYTETA